MHFLIIKLQFWFLDHIGAFIGAHIGDMSEILFCSKKINLYQRFEALKRKAKAARGFKLYKTFKYIFNCYNKFEIIS